MKRSGVRLGIKNNLSPSTPAHGDIQGSEGTNSATLAQAERQIKALQEENKKLKDDFSEISTMYHQLVREASHEKYDERRVIALKAHIIQLERQLMTFADAQGARAASLMEVENALAGIADCARSHLAGEKAVGASVGSISIPRSDLTGIVESSESARIKLYKTIESVSPEKLNRPLLMMDRFVKQSPWQPITLMDVCSGKLEHLNLKHVSKLESQLAQLYKQLMLVNRGLYNIQRSNKKGDRANSEVPSALYERLGTEVSQACMQLNNVTRDLLDLTLLVPAAPWPPLQKPHIQELSTDDVVHALPSFPRSKAAEGRHLVEALLKCYTLNKHMTNLENQALSEELKFHQCVYDLQQEYTQSLFGALRDGYAEFEESTNKLICHPLSDIMENYRVLRSDASEDALREFLAVFKQHADQLEDAVNVLKPDENRNSEGGKAALSQFGEDFLKSLNHIHAECQKNRDKMISNLEEIKGQQQEYSEEIKEMFKKSEEPSPDPVAEYAEITKRTAEMDLDDTQEESVNDSAKTTVKSKTKRSSSNNTKVRSRGSLEQKQSDDSSMCSCGADDTLDQSNEPEGANRSTPSESLPTGRRSTSIGNISTRRSSDPQRTPPTPKSSRIASRGIPTPSPISTPGSRIPTQRSRSSQIPGATPGSHNRSRGPPGGRLTPISKLVLKPKSEQNGSPVEPLPSPQSDTSN